MKPITKTLCLLLTCFFVFSSCEKKQKSHTLLNLDELKKYTITYEKASELQKNYIETRANPLNAYLDSINYFRNNKKGLVANDQERKIIEDVRDVTFDLKTVKQYIAYVEKEAKKRGLKGLGLRVYFGVYPKNDTLKDAGFSTVFFMPTHQKPEAPNNGNNFFYWFDDEVIDGVDGLNFGTGGHPPNDLESDN